MTVERRKRISAGEVAEALARHEKECAERYGVILSEFKAFREEFKPVIEIYRASTFGGRAIMKLVLFLASISAIAFGWLKYKAGA